MRLTPNRRRDSTGHLIIDGETFMGRYRVPPMPNRMVLTDEVTGLYQALEHNGVMPTLPVITDLKPDDTLFPSTEGPTYEGWRLFLSSGSLIFRPAFGLSGPLILTRHDYETTVLQLTPDNVGNVVYSVYAL